VALVNSTTDTQKTRLSDRTDRAWFNRLLRHPARKRSGSNLSTPEPEQGQKCDDIIAKLHDCRH